LNIKGIRAIENPAKYKQSDKIRLCPGLRIIKSLSNKQPQKIEDIIKNAKINTSSFYRERRVLMNEGLVKEVSAGYALWYYDEGSLWNDLLQVFRVAGGRVKRRVCLQE
jgi:DNA-binding IclR family transcriptional regulator